MSHGWQEQFSFVQAKHSSGITHLCEGCKAADYPLKVLKTFDGSMRYVKHALVRGSGGMPPPHPRENLKIRIFEGASAGYPHLSRLRLLSDEYYNSKSMSSGPPDLHKE